MSCRASQWRHNVRDSVSSHQPHDCLLNRLIRRRSKKTPKLRVTGLCAGNSPGTGEFPAQMASCAEHVSIWWRHHDYTNIQVPVYNPSNARYVHMTCWARLGEYSRITSCKYYLRNTICRDNFLHEFFCTFVRKLLFYYIRTDHSFPTSHQIYKVKNCGQHIYIFPLVNYFIW